MSLLVARDLDGILLNRGGGKRHAPSAGHPTEHAAPRDIGVTETSTEGGAQVVLSFDVLEIQREVEEVDVGDRLCGESHL